MSVKKKALKILFLTIALSAFGLNDGYAAAQKPLPTAKPAAAQKSAAVTESKAEEAASDEFDLKQVSAKIAAIEKDLADENYTKQSLDEALTYLSDVEIKLEATIRKLEKESAYAQESLATFGEKPAEGEEEDSSIAEMREKYNAAVANYKSKLIEANLLLTETARISTLTNEKRSHILIGNLVAEKNMIIVPKTFWHATRDAAVFFWQLTISPVQWFKNLSEEGRTAFFNNIWYVLLIFGVALTFGLWLRRFIMRRWGYQRVVEQPRYGQKVSVAVITALAYGVIPSLLIGGCLLWEFTNKELLDSQFGKVLAHAFFTALLACALEATVMWSTLNMTSPGSADFLFT